MKTEEQFEAYVQNLIGKVEDERQKQALKGFLTSLTSQSIITRFHYLLAVKKLGMTVGKPYEEMTKQDIAGFMSGIRNAGSYNTHLIPIKVFFKWLGKPEVVKDLKQRKTNKTFTPSELLTPEDVMKLANAMGNLMWKAFTLTLFESAARVSEVLSLKVGDVEFHNVRTKDNKIGLVATLYFTRSKGNVRKEPVAITMFAMELKKWLESHPHKDNPNAYLFYAQKYDLEASRALDLTTVRTMLLKAKKITKIKKKVNPHWLRHSMLSYCANALNYNEQLLMWRAGWVDTTMAKRYVHSGGRLQNSAYLRKLGFDIEEESEVKVLEPKICHSCGNLNPQTNKLCDVCGMPLELEQYKEVIEGKKNLEDKVNLLSQQVEMLQNVIKQLASPSDEQNIKSLLRNHAKERLDEATGEAKPIKTSTLKLPKE